MRRFAFSTFLLILVLLWLPRPASAEFSAQTRARVSDQMMRQIGGNDEPAPPYVQQVVDRLRACAKRHEIDYRAVVVPRSEVNAFALPDGRLVLTAELTRRLPTDDLNALAFVLGHEMSHVELEHAERKLSQSQTTNILVRILGAVNPVAGTLGGFSKNLVTSGYSRGCETDADLHGLDLMTQAGYNPVGALVTLRILDSLEKSGGRVFPTHPRARDRYRNCVNWMKKHNFEIPAEFAELSHRASERQEERAAPSPPPSPFDPDVNLGVPH